MRGIQDSDVQTFIEYASLEAVLQSRMARHISDISMNASITAHGLTRIFRAMPFLRKLWIRGMDGDEWGSVAFPISLRCVFLFQTLADAGARSSDVCFQVFLQALSQHAQLTVLKLHFEADAAVSLLPLQGMEGLRMLTVRHRKITRGWSEQHLRELRAVTQVEDCRIVLQPGDLL